MRILILNHEFPPVGGGAATARREIAVRIVGRGHRVSVLTGPRSQFQFEPSDGWKGHIERGAPN